MEELVTKLCPMCMEMKPLTMGYFHRNKGTSTGFTVYCRECGNKKNKESYQNNREAAYERKKRNKERYGNRYQEAWNERNPIKRQYLNLQSSARKRGLEICPYEEFRLWSESKADICYYCHTSLWGKRKTVDRQNNGIGYMPNNMVKSCNPCNAGKSQGAAEGFKGIYSREKRYTIQELHENRHHYTVDPKITWVSQNDGRAIRQFLDWLEINP